MPTNVRLWIAGRTDEYRGPGRPSAWEILGIYFTESEAAARCKQPDRDFIGLIEVGVDLPEHLTPWTAAYHPLRFPSHEAEQAALVSGAAVMNSGGE